MPKPAPSLPVFGSDWPPVARTTAVADRSPVAVVTIEIAVRGCCARDVEHATAGLERRADAAGFPQQRVEHVARSIGVGKQLAAGLLVEADADLAEERRRRRSTGTREGCGGRSTSVRPRSRRR